MRIAFIVQRYGAEILGGSEYHCRLIAERMAERHDVEVLTTCARDYITWKNEYPEGDDRARGVTIRRFRERRGPRHPVLQSVLRLDLQLPAHEDDEMEWLRRQGPWCPALVDYLEQNHRAYDVLIFFTYLYAPDGAGPEGGARAQHPGADRARRAGHPAGHLPRDVQPARGHRLQHRDGAAIPQGRVRDRGAGPNRRWAAASTCR